MLTDLKEEWKKMSLKDGLKSLRKRKQVHIHIWKGINVGGQTACQRSSSYETSSVNVNKIHNNDWSMTKKVCVCFQSYFGAIYAWTEIILILHINLRVRPLQKDYTSGIVALCSNKIADCQELKPIDLFFLQWSSCSHRFNLLIDFQPFLFLFFAKSFNVLERIKCIFVTF